MLNYKTTNLEPPIFFKSSGGLKVYVGLVLGDKYIIKAKLDAGNYGQVFEVDDISNPNLSLVAKISKNDESFAKELKTL